MSPLFTGMVTQALLLVEFNSSLILHKTPKLECDFIVGVVKLPKVPCDVGSVHCTTTDRRPVLPLMIPINRTRDKMDLPCRRAHPDKLSVLLVHYLRCLHACAVLYSTAPPLSARSYSYLTTSKQPLFNVTSS